MKHEYKVGNWFEPNVGVHTIGVCRKPDHISRRWAILARSANGQVATWQWMETSMIYLVSDSVCVGLSNLSRKYTLIQTNCRQHSTYAQHCRYIVSALKPRSCNRNDFLLGSNITAMIFDSVTITGNAWDIRHCERKHLQLWSGAYFVTNGSGSLNYNIGSVQRIFPWGVGAILHR